MWTYVGKYAYVDLGLPSDAATVNWGKEWRMPTADEFRFDKDNHYVATFNRFEDFSVRPVRDNSDSSK